MTIPLILYTDEQIKLIQENNTKQCKQNTTKCLFHEISTETMRVIYKHAPDQTNLFNSYHRYIHSLWLSYNPFLNQRLLYVNIDCRSNETCSKLDEALHRSKKPIGLYLEYVIQEPEQHQMIISDKHLLKTNIHSAELILEGDVELFLHELLRVADVRNNEKYVLAQVDLFLLKETLRKQLLGQTLILTAENDEKQWNSIYGKTNDTLPPDRVFKLFKKKVHSACLSKKRTSNDTDIQTEMDNYTNTSQKGLTSSSSLQLKPMLAFELNKFNRSRFLVHQPIHMTQRDDIHLIPIRSILPSKEKQSTSNRTNNDSNEPEELRGIIEKLQKSLADCETNKRQSSTTASIPESTIIETADSEEQQWTSTSDADTTSDTSTEITVTTNEDETLSISMTTEIPDGSFGKTYDGVWVEAQDGKIPPDAVIGGQEGNQSVYVVRFKTQEGDMIPGKLVETSKIAEVPYWGVRTSSAYQVLTNPESTRKFEWITTSDYNIPEGAFVAGKEKVYNLYIGRVRHGANSILVGKYKAPHGALFFTHEGKEKRQTRDFEVLCVS